MRSGRSAVVAEVANRTTLSGLAVASMLTMRLFQTWKF